MTDFKVLIVCGVEQDDQHTTHLTDSFHQQPESLYATTVGLPLVSCASAFTGDRLYRARAQPSSVFPPLTAGVQIVNIEHA